MGLPVDRKTAEGRFNARLILRGYATLVDEMHDLVPVPHRAHELAVSFQ
jgi:hypothetical protein